MSLKSIATEGFLTGSGELKAVATEGYLFQDVPGGSIIGPVVNFVLKITRLMEW